MRKISFYLSILFCFSNLICFAQYGTQFENRGFESWANFGSGSDTYEPVHWHSGKSASGTYNDMLSKQIEPSTVVRPGSTGIKSVRIWPEVMSFWLFDVTANGNLTCGRMNAGSMTASGNNNYSYTVRSDSRFNTPINTVPDSLTVWVCFRSISSDQDARARAMVHGDDDFREVADGTFNPSDMLVATASATFKRTSPADGAYTWRRLSVPFVHNGPCNDPKYILFTITTNVTPGEGSGVDDMYVDDVLLVYNPSIQMGALEKDHYQIGESLTIPFTLDGTMSPENLNKAENQVIAQLSSANGSFSTPTELGRVTTNTSGSITVTIPSGIYVGEHYRIRLVTTNYPMVSEDNGNDLTIVSVDKITENHENRLNIYPNPANHVIHCISEEIMTEVALFTVTGEKVWSSTNMSEAIDIPVNGLTTGIYLVKCQFGIESIVRNVIIN